MGMVPVPDKVKSGEFHYNMGMYETPVSAAKTLATRPGLELGSIIATAVTPLSKATMAPDVVVVVAIPEQVFWIAPAAATFQEGGRMAVEIAAVQASCADSTVRPLTTGELSISLGCFGCRKTTDMAPEEMLVGIPGAKLVKIVGVLEDLGGNAIPKSRIKA